MVCDKIKMDIELRLIKDHVLDRKTNRWYLEDFLSKDRCVTERDIGIEAITQKSELMGESLEDFKNKVEMVKHGQSSELPADKGE